MKQHYSTQKKRSGRWLSLLAALGLLTTASAQAPYCANTAGASGDEEIYNVMINGVNTHSNYAFANACVSVAPGPGSLSNRYSNFMTLGSSYSVTQGVVSTFSVQEDECDGPTYFNNHISIWIDYNQDSDFSDPGEQIYGETVLTVSPRNVTGTFVVPFSASTGTTAMRVRVMEGNVTANSNPCAAYSWGETEDYIITVQPGQPCAGTPGANTIVPTTTLVCPVFGTTTLNLATTYTVGAINYQWQQSTISALGPWTPAIGNATTSAYTSPTLATTTWYQLVAACAWGGNSLTLSSVQIDVANTTTNTVPYFEGFEGISTNGQLPNCSWWRSDNIQCSSRTQSITNTTWRQARTGSKFAEFDGSNNVYANTRYYYTNGILLNAGITYSASLWYNNNNQSTWANLGIAYGTAQNPNGLVNIVNINNTSTTGYTPLGGTFTVATTGLYYIAVRATENYWASQLVWDDLSITTPCQFSNNQPNITLTSTTSVCAGQSVTINAAGAGSYTWSTNQNGPSITVAPPASTSYFVTGANSITGCTASVSQAITVNQLPAVAIFSIKDAVCEGESLNLQAFGANSYTWNTGTTSAQLNVVPTGSSFTYSVIGADALGCKKTAVKTISVNPLPLVAVSGSTRICLLEFTTLTASGAGAGGVYTWASPSSFFQGNPAQLGPQSTVVYTVTGTTPEGCKGSKQLAVVVDPCVGLSELNANAIALRVYPNPGSGLFTVSYQTARLHTIEVCDLSGRVLTSLKDSATETNLDLSNFANGVYLVRVSDGTVNQVVKLVKQ